MKCRHCYTELEHTFLDLGFAPPSNAYLGTSSTSQSEVYFPLRLKVCTSCWLVQTEDYSRASDLFTSDYAYFSSTSSSWLMHAKKYVNKVTELFHLNESSFVIEVASNDGYLLKNFVDRSIPCLGIEPTDSTADQAEKNNVPTIRSFFGEVLANDLISKGKQADLIIGNNVFAHVPDINDFTKGLKKVLKANGVITLEFPHLLKLLKYSQFDTVYHEHYSYLSLYAVQKIFASVGLKIFDVEELTTHGGSLRVYGCHADDQREITNQVDAILLEEKKFGMQSLEIYLQFQEKADKIKNDFIEFLIIQKRAGKKVVGYGAAAKGNTLLNYSGIKTDLIISVCDMAPSKQGKLLPGSHIPILHPKKTFEIKPDFVVIFPWNIKDEVISAWKEVHNWGGKFVVAVPVLQII